MLTLADVLDLGNKGTTPGPRGHPLLGSLPAARRDPLKLFMESFRDSGDRSGAAGEVGPALAFLLAMVNQRTSRLLFFGRPLLPTPENFRIRRSLATLDAVVQRIIAERRKGALPKWSSRSRCGSTRRPGPSPARSRRRTRSAAMKSRRGPSSSSARTWCTAIRELVLATIARRVRFELQPGHPVVPDPSITLRPRYGMKMRVS